MGADGVTEHVDVNDRTRAPARELRGEMTGVFFSGVR